MYIYIYIYTCRIIRHMLLCDVTLCKPALDIIVFYASPGVFPACICPSPLHFPTWLAWLT